MAMATLDPYSITDKLDETAIDTCGPGLIRGER